MCKSYDFELINEMSNSINLLDYASSSYRFRRTGQYTYATNCPRHRDDTPSLIVYSNNNTYYCYSCHKYGKIFNWFMDFEGLSFDDSIVKLSNLSGCKYKQFKQCSSMSFFKQCRDVFAYKKTQEKHTQINKNIFNSYSSQLPQEWIDEGISVEQLKKFNIKIDNNSNRIVYPVFDDDFNLIGVKGRTRNPNYKELNIPKYINYYKITTGDFFIGMKENIDNIKRTNTVIIFEGIKSVMKVGDWGYTNAVATETSHLNDGQAEILIKRGIKNIIFAYDSDVSEEDIIKSCNKVKLFANVFYIKDVNNLLDDKMSPCDKGRAVFEELLKAKVRL